MPITLNFARKKWALYQISCYIRFNPLQECASEKSYCLAMQSEGMIEDLVRHLSSQNQQLKMLCASAIFRLAEEDESRYLVKLHGGLEPLVQLLDEGENYDNKGRELARLTSLSFETDSEI